MNVRFDQVDQNPEPRRLALLRIAPECVLGLIRSLDAGRRITSVGLPTDAVVVDASYDLQYRCFVLALEDPSFQEVPFGGVAPYIDVVLTDHGPWAIPDSA